MITPTPSLLAAYCRDLIARIVALCAGLSISLAMLLAISPSVSAIDSGNTGPFSLVGTDRSHQIDSNPTGTLTETDQIVIQGA